jgi:predicted mannosyl-3-phosphoglycerate phosphatase (HAD superfamily)
MGDKEMTLREASIFTLEQSQVELENLKENLKKASQEFDQGNDIEGLTYIQENLINPIKNLSEYCNTLLNNFSGIFTEELREEFLKEYTALGETLMTLAKETEKGDFTEVGDLLRFDLNDLIEELAATFPKLAECFKNCKFEELDQY